MFVTRALNLSTGRRLAERVLQAETWWERMRGLLGRKSFPPGEGMLLAPCRAVHTVGMRFPIDLVFLDPAGRVVRSASRVPPFRIVAAGKGACRVLELPAGALETTQTGPGHRIFIEMDKGLAGDPRVQGLSIDLVLCLLFGSLAAGNLTHLLKVPTPGGVALFLINTVAACLFLVRKRATRVSRRPSDWMLALSTLVLPWGLRSATLSIGYLPWAGHFLKGVGLLIILWSLLSLNRSFGLVPADRGLVTCGPYRWIRHPMYAGELLFFLGFGLEHPTTWNGVLLLGLLIGLPVRAKVEERLLVAASPAYRTYRERVRWRFLPAVF